MIEDQERFEEIIGEISELAKEALDLLPEDMQENASSYWYSHILCALNDDHEFAGGSMLHMNDTLEEWTSNSNNNSYSQTDLDHSSEDEDWD